MIMLYDTNFKALIDFNYHEAVHAYITYLQKYYVGDTRGIRVVTPRFPIKMWNFYKEYVYFEIT